MAAATSPSPTGAPARNTMSTRSTELVKGTHQFNIAGYSLQKRIGVGNFIRSGAFEVGGYSWAIRCYPAGNAKGDEYHVSLYLDLLSAAIEEIVTVKYIFEISGPTGNSSPCVQTCAWDDFSPKNKTWGYRKFVKIESVESMYLSNDCLTIRCTVEVQKDSKTGATRSHFITVPPSAICQDLARLFESKHGADVTFQIGQNAYDAHKAVVAMRSPVFSAQFFGSMADKPGSGRFVRIQDVKPEAFEAVLHFIYTDTLPAVEDGDFRLAGCANYPGLRELPADCSKECHRELVCDWLAVADLYGLERMRLMCESLLSETINVENAAATLLLADRHNCPQLKAFCVDYIASPGVLTDVLATKGYREGQGELSLRSCGCRGETWMRQLGIHSLICRVWV